MEFGNDLVKGTVVPVVLRLLSECERYGYEIVKIVNDRTDGALQWKEGTLYPCLHRLEADGLLRSNWRTAESGKRRKYYGVTRKGRAEMAARVQEWKAFSGAVGVLLLGGA